MILKIWCFCFVKLQDTCIRCHRLQGILVCQHYARDFAVSVKAHLNISDVCPTATWCLSKKQWIFGRQYSGIILNFTLFSKNCLVTPAWQDKHDLSRCKAGNRQLHGNCGHLLRWRKDQWRGSWNDDCRSCHTQPACTVRTSIKVLKTEVLGRF